jgi:hypothetical protein
MGTDFICSRKLFLFLLGKRQIFPAFLLSPNRFPEQSVADSARRMIAQSSWDEGLRGFFKSRGASRMLRFQSLAGSLPILIVKSSLVKLAGGLPEVETGVRIIFEAGEWA